MRRQIALSAFGLLVVGLVSFAAAQNQADAKKNDVTGTWKWSQEGPGGTIEFVLKLKQDGEKVSGTVTGFGGDESPITDGKVTKDGEVSFKSVRDFGGRPITTMYTGKVSGDTFKGKSETIFAQDISAKRDK